MTKRIVSIIATVMLVIPLQTFAWSKFSHEVIALYATQKLHPKVKKQVERLLDDDMRSQSIWLNTLRDNGWAQHTAAWHKMILDANNNPVRGANDLLTQLERCEDVLRNRQSHKREDVVTALKTYIHLVSDMHNPARVIFEDIPRSKGFKFKTTNNRNDDFAHRGTKSWNNLWDGTYSKHPGFTVEWATHDLSIFARENEVEWSKGTAAVWSEELGAEYRKLYDIFNETDVIDPRPINRMEEVYDRGKAKAALRLAAMLNDIFAK